MLQARRGFRADVQGLRAIAVGLVLLFHAGVPFFGGGYVGVDVFFVISGFLISSHLLEALERDGRIDFGEFYARRIRRILPASLVVATLTVLAAIIIYPVVGLERVLRDAIATILYVPNIWFAIQETDYLADHSPSPYQHYWSLGVEEQFYLLWPVLLLLGFLLVRRSRAGLTLVVTALLSASFVAAVVLTAVHQPSAFFLLPTRAWELLLGALIGLLLLGGRSRGPLWARAGAGWLGVGMIVASAVLFDASTPFPGVAAALPTVGTALVIYFGASDVRGGPSLLLDRRPMQFIGLISYSLYLVHWPLLVLGQVAVGEHRPLSLMWKIVLGIVVAVPLAWLLFRLVETPLRAPKALTSRRPAVTIVSTLVLTAALACGLLAATQWAAQREVPVGPPIGTVTTFPETPPEANGFVSEDMTPALADVSDDVAPMYDDGCHHDVFAESVQDCAYGEIGGEVQVAVFGDSHSAQWFPAAEAFAEETGGVEIRAFTKSSCPAVSATVVVSSAPYDSCDRWREAVLRHLEQNPPQLVIISSYAHYPLVKGADEESRHAVWADGIEVTVERLRAAGVEVLVIADTPRFDSAPAACAAANPLDVLVCAGDRAAVLDGELTAAEAAAVVRAGGTYADLTDYICTDTDCPVVIANHFVYRDVNHLTGTFVRYLAPELIDVMSGLLAR